MKILVVDEEPPYPADSGKKIRTLNLLKELAQRHSVTIVCYTEKGSASIAYLQGLGIRIIPVRPRRFETGIALYARLAINLFSKYPFSVSKHMRRRFHRTVRALLTAEQFDLLHCEWTPYAPFAFKNSSVERTADLPARRLPVVIATHNIEADILTRRAEQQSNRLGRKFFQTQAARMEAFERNAFSQADVVTAVSEKDELRAREWGAHSTGVVHNGVDTEAITPCPSGSAVTAKELLFLGSLDWFPNQDAIRYFIEDIFPLARKLDKEILLNIVGRRPDQALRKIAASTEGVTLTGEVDDVVPFLRKAAAVVVPLRIGGGTRIKIIEAMSAGKVVVSTTIGAEGLDVEDGTHILIADTPETFAVAIVKALGGTVSERISANARNLVEKKYGWKRQAENLEDLWEAAIKSQQSVGKSPPAVSSAELCKAAPAEASTGIARGPAFHSAGLFPTRQPVDAL